MTKLKDHIQPLMDSVTHYSYVSEYESANQGEWENRMSGNWGDKAEEARYNHNPELIDAVDELIQKVEWCYKIINGNPCTNAEGVIVEAYQKYQRIAGGLKDE